jgi:hypothetical protein
MIDAEKSDLYDVLAYIAFALLPITWEERVTTRRDKIFARYDQKLQAFPGICPVPIRQGRRWRTGSGQTAAPAGAEIQGGQRRRCTAWRRGADPRRVYRISEASL